MGYEYTMGGTKLDSSECEKDLGVVVHQTLSQSAKWARAAKKAKQGTGAADPWSGVQQQEGIH